MSEGPKTKYALVTGGSRGIGRAICKQLAADHGFAILVNYRSGKDAAEEVLKQLIADGGQGETIYFDVADAEQVNAALNAWREAHPDAVIEVVVNNAGVTKDNLFVWMKPEEWSTVLDTSLNGFFNVTSALIQDMIVRRSGRIINMASVSGVKGTPGQVNYSAAKGAVVAATKALAQEVAKRNITVNAVAPGFITTDMTKDLDEANLKKLVPANRFGTAEEVAHLVSFLASPKASYITGEVININGGIYS
ncbi:MAG: 3-oxoacyl-ACP reductase FabG [Flavobacteriales bacterium]|jgi:3-oxoacyl-[acyl-carrier protein] reductase|nr:3-oxoacyl-ACP reductase FabG [Flavobacteriales bacterium]MBK6893061.1 3-oxoacyl-ACP reductase FabG [Flavobacteriales bacterium]MBK7249219.1 3-oxoacyl-ACP reductase FabG [Flavobacteriales bacterium]MBK7285776.1 3-oxoacyl-ACP reductase FabG [Flavobacteriales bacterium]MBK9058547.1 3-oxoacyl-ACP reductase FabG [Flavobacteriales bacterium]